MFPSVLDYNLVTAVKVVLNSHTGVLFLPQYPEEKTLALWE
jgi:hypothetical protein